MHSSKITLILTVCALCPALSYAGSTSFSTYYPAPTGNYQKIKSDVLKLKKLTTEAEITEACSSIATTEKGVYLNSDGNLQFCSGDEIGSEGGGGGDTLGGAFKASADKTAVYPSSLDDAPAVTPNVGIATKSPLHSLDLDDGEGFNVNSDGIEVYTSGTKHMTINSDGNVGIGADPSGSEKLTVSGDTKITGDLTVAKTGAGAANETALTVSDDDGTYTLSPDATGVLKIQNGAGGGNVDAGQISATGVTTTGDVLVSGKVGIANAAPTEALEVTGNVKVSDTMTATKIKAINSLVIPNCNDAATDMTTPGSMCVSY